MPELKKLIDQESVSKLKKEITVRVNVDYFIYEGKPAATVSICLPGDPITKEGLHPLLLDQTTEVFNEPLKRNWGIIEREKNCSGTIIIGETWTEVERKVLRLLKYVEETLKDVYTKNIKKLEELEKGMPENKEITISLNKESSLAEVLER